MTTKKKKKNSTLTCYQGCGRAKKKRKAKQEVISYSNQEKGYDSLFNQPQPIDDCWSLALWSSASQEPEAVLQTNVTSGDCDELQSPFEDSESCLRDRNEVLTYKEDKTVYNVLPQLCDEREENLDPLLCELVAEDSCRHILQSQIYTKLRNVAYTLELQKHQPLVTLQSPIYTKRDTAVTNIHKASIFLGCQSLHTVLNAVIGDLNLRKQFKPKRVDFSRIKLHTTGV